MSKKNKTLVLVLLLAVVLLAAVPFLTLKDAEFGGSDDAGSVMVEEIHGEYEPWFTPVLEDFLGKEIPGEVESLLFCVQTGIGVGIIAFCMGDRKSTRLNSSHDQISYAVFCLKKKNFFNDTATTEIYTLSLHDALPISPW